MKQQRHVALMLLVIVLALAATGLLGSKGSAASQPTPQTSPLVRPEPTPNPKCGVAGGHPYALEALKISVGAPEPDGVVWGLMDGNAAQMVRPCCVWTTARPVRGLRKCSCASMVAPGIRTTP